MSLTRVDSESLQVKRVYHRLKEIGVSSWFDEEAMLLLLLLLLYSRYRS